MRLKTERVRADSPGPVSPVYPLPHLSRAAVIAAAGIAVIVAAGITVIAAAGAAGITVIAAVTAITAAAVAVSAVVPAAVMIAFIRRHRALFQGARRRKAHQVPGQ